MEAYVYSPLPDSGCGDDVFIRLLILSPRPKLDTTLLTCSIFATPLSQAPPYEAVSYCWGDDKDRENVCLMEPGGDGTCAGSTKRSVQIPKTLIPFLYRTRSAMESSGGGGKSKILWIDSICIDQSSDAEKSSQVSHMRDIYARATATNIWLGEEGDSSTLALAYAQALRHGLESRVGKEVIDGRNLTIDHILSSRPGTGDVSVRFGDPQLEAFFRLLQRPWFTRAWIVQESVVSKNAHFICGASSQPWLTIFCAWAYLMGFHTWIWSVYPAQQLWHFLALGFSQKDWENGTKVKWWKLLARHRSFAAKDPRDKIFSFWGLGCQLQFEEMGIVPRYEESAEVLYTRLAVKAIENGHTEIFSIPRLVDLASNNILLLNIPTWTPDWRYTSSTPSTLTQSEGCGTTWMPPWTASSTSTFTPTFSFSGSKILSLTNPRPKLCLQGYIVGRIARLTAQAWEEPTPTAANSTLREEARIMQQTQFQIQTWENVLISRTPFSLLSPCTFFMPSFWAMYGPVKSDSCLRAAYTTLFGGILLDGNDKDMRFAMSYFLCRQIPLLLLRLFHMSVYVWPWLLVVLLEKLLKKIGYIQPDMLFRTNCAGSPMVNRKAASVLGENGVRYMALVPKISEVGDYVVVCKGLRVPLLLREVEGGGNGEWEFVGDAYVHGVMKGEVWEKRELGGEECAVFWVV